VDSRIEERLLALNREFYQNLAEPFARSRRSPQPGIGVELARVGPDLSVLDLGCGHGTLAQALHAQGHTGRYLGLDATPALLERAAEWVEHRSASFRQADLASPGWAQQTGRFDWVFCLATLHHLPVGRQAIWAAELRLTLSGDSQVVVSVWNFLAEDGWRNRIQPWSSVGLDEGQLDPGDYLLDWRGGGHGLRYVHHFDEGELARVADWAGCRVAATHYAGSSSGRLNLIQRWQPQPAASLSPQEPDLVRSS